ncbi:dolichyl-phosphate-mannose--protein mannosyltransferase [Agrococcus sediminis]|uniref:dolichyl-phosphate-mannose--protein mannosyltransferase n=1 Tax=Agrococcus sediminis TaxID=2599924 RepID=UPI00381FE1CE
MTDPRAAEPDDGARASSLAPAGTAVAVEDEPAPARPATRAPGRFVRAYGALEARLAEPRIRRRIEVGAPIAIVAIAAVARLTALGHPGILVFDETYYVKEGWSTWQLGYEGEWAEGSDERFQEGDPGGLTTEADYVVHPPLGKWIIGMAMAVFGMADPFWWRLPSALAGIALVGLTYAIARGLLRSVAFASLAGLWMAIDGFAIVMSRTALLDGILALFVLAGAGALLVDRRGSPARTVRALAERPRRILAAMWTRPWLVIAGVLLGAACATKWSGAVFLAAFGLWTVLLDALDRRRAGYRSPWLGTLLSQAPASFVLLVGPALVVYVASYAGWFDGGWGSQLMLERADLRWGGLLAWVPLGLQSLWAYHAQQLGFHVGLTGDHSYQSPAYEWLWLGRPTGFEMASGDAGTWWVTALPNLVVWYGGIVALGFLLYRFGRTLDRRVGFLLVAIAAGYVPWLAFPERTIFFFYAIVFLPFLVIGLAHALQVLVGPPRRPSTGSVSAWPDSPVGAARSRSTDGIGAGHEAADDARPVDDAADASARLDADLAAAVPAPAARAAARPARDDVERRAWGWLTVAALVLASIAVALWFLPVWYGIELPSDLVRLRYWPPTWPGR